MYKGFFINHVYTEVFIVALNLGRHQRIEIYSELFDVMESLNPRSINNSKDIKVVHGHLLSATILPSSFNGVGAFILVNLPNTNYGLFTGDTFYSPDELAAAIQTIVSHKHDKIEDIFVLYGTEIALTLSVAADELDEELVERSGTITKEIRQIETELEMNR